MNEAYRRLIGNLPWRDAPPGAPFVHDARTLRAWIEQLPMANFQVATRRLLEGLQALNRSRSDGTRRLEALEMLRGAVVQLAIVTDEYCGPVGETWRVVIELPWEQGGE